MTIPTVYIHPKCSTCKKATEWLDAQGIACETKDIRETPPSINELKQMLAHRGEVRKLFNTSGMDYRAGNLKERLPGMGDDEALAVLNSNGMLVKRPFLLTNDGGLTGFREAEWTAFFGK